jgi:hypothetical protein
MKALISTFENAIDPTDREKKRILGQRVAQIVEDDQTFEVGDSMIWVNCSDSFTADACYYDANDNTIKPFPAAS